MMRTWLKSAMAELDRLYDHPDPHGGVWERCAAIATEAGDRAARLGLADLHKASLAFGVMAEPMAVKSYLAACLTAYSRPSEYLTLAEAAQVLGYSESGLRKLVRKRAIRYSQQTKHGAIRFRREWLDEFVEGNPAPVKAPRQAKRKLVHVPNRFGFDSSLLKL